ncbi:hypothetical protein [Sphingosinicella sp. CPCC 101087]|uniref:hypothetical protein n=1 Tax=Sphingosinicella sp. CPCC 101087 TaxID=2497754 RepID=UPI00101DEBCA|nr:hypothetical protein [Sphingosinicella sp. CPCC 101087]
MHSSRPFLLTLLIAAPLAAEPDPGSVEAAAIFEAAGFARQAGQWSACGDPGTPSYAPGSIETIRDLNGDGRAEAVVTEGSTFCYGMTGLGYTLVSQQADGRWKRVAGGQGIPRFLETRGSDNWPDIEVGGPGFCFPVLRWNGSEYALDRHEYEGRSCRPGI